MKTTLMYGKQGRVIDIPDHSVVLEPKEIADLIDEEQGVLAALRDPIALCRLRKNIAACRFASRIVEND